MKFPVSECKYCGGNYFEVKGTTKGVFADLYNSDGEFINTTEPTDSLFYKYGKRWFCANSKCGRQLFTVKDIKE
ncbi:hypothetical protein P7D17_07270 [Lactococcus petauri]|uniref:Uncharacterized protein n=1 Tax=Lactococcus petauri TaxID=1940789 RepID=A0AAJ2IVJ0_9LACT|nr:hypothetical protein [Lactococcus petauri]MDT2583914.1 hypothetical protein [Lactococcus petauri]